MSAGHKIALFQINKGLGKPQILCHINCNKSCTLGKVMEKITQNESENVMYKIALNAAKVLLLEQFVNTKCLHFSKELF